MSKFWIRALGLACLAVTAEAAEPVDFNFDVRRILSDRCYVCHGPDEEDREADLRLDARAGLFKESDSGNVGHIVAPGKPQASELWLRVASDDPDVMMPPPDSNLSLTDAEKQALRRWIEQGATWKGHWSVQPFEKASHQDASVADAVDHFVGQRLRRHGFALSPAADPETLLRRAAFDLTGMPAEEELAQAFLKAPSAAAFKELLRELLASPRYGERMASQWLDAARYSDTYGYQVDRDRFVWPYRDWVVRAFNRNLSYADFVTWQLAGDLLPDASEEQMLATTFNRLHPQKVEGGSVPEEFRIEYVADRTQTFATAMLGLTLECARCHDHKYDPIAQKEYYQLTAFFDKIDEAGLYSYFTPAIPTPTLMLDREDHQAELAKLVANIRAEERALERMRAELRSEFLDGENPAPSDQITGQVEHVDFEGLKGGANKPVPGVRGQAILLSGDDGYGLKTGNFTREQPFSISLWMSVPKHFERTVVFHRSRAWTDSGSRGYQLLLEDGRLSASLIHFWPGNALRVRTTEAVPIDRWQHVTWTYDGSSRAAGLKLFVNGQPAELEVVRDNLYKHITGGGGDNITIGQRFRDIGFSQGKVDEFRVFARELTAVEIRHLADGKTLTEKWGGRGVSAEDRYEFFLHHHAGYQAQLKELAAARKALNKKQDSFREIMVMEAMQAERQTYVLTRGAYDVRAEPVTAQTPGWLPPMAKDARRDRLGLARWLTREDHPLTARVAVNRIWQALFGEGLVRTPEDFGSQGQLPTHPQLLDWLARDFVEHGFDVKRLLQGIMLSKTYQQRSLASEALREADPENRWLGRAPQYRWPAEMLRDQALQVSGLLVEKLGGAPVKPYDLAESFKASKPDDGEGLYRRSLYTYWKRTGPAPMMMALDAAKRDVCRVKRSRTSGPLQTLVVLNSHQFVEAARALAVRILAEEPDEAQRLVEVFRCLTGRAPDAREREIVAGLYEELLKEFGQEPEAAKQYLGVGKQAVDAKLDQTRVAALAGVANALFGFDASMMKY